MDAMATLLPFFCFSSSSPFFRLFSLSFPALFLSLCLYHAPMPVHVEKRVRKMEERGQWHEMKTFKASVIFTEVFNPFRDIIRGRNKIDGTGVVVGIGEGDGKRNA